MRVKKLNWGDPRSHDGGLRIWYSYALGGAYFMVVENRNRHFEAYYVLSGEESLGVYETEIEAKKVCRNYCNDFMLIQLCE